MEISIKLVIDLAPSTVASIEKIAGAFGRPQVADLDKLLQVIAQTRDFVKTDRPGYGPDEYKKAADIQETPPPGEPMTGIDITPAPEVKRSHKKKPAAADAPDNVVRFPVEVTPPVNGVLTLATVQALSKAKAQAGHAKAIKGFLAELDIEKVSELAVADLEDFHAKLAAL